MSDFYQMQPANQANSYEVLAHRALLNWGIENASLELLKMRENAVFGVCQADGSKYALRIHRAGYHSDAELRSELQWMRALDANGISTPGVIPTNNGELFTTVAHEEVPEPRQVDLLAWIDGLPMGSIEDGMEGDLDELLHNYLRIGALAGRVHNFSANWKLPEGFVRHHWDAEGLVGEQPVWGQFWENERLSLNQRELILRAREVVRKQLQLFGKTEENYGLIHADFLPENLMTRGDEIQMIDFDDSGFGWYMFELATSLFVHLGEDHFDAVLAALVEGYRSQRELPDEHLAYLPVFFMARLFSYLGWLHTREITETTEEMAPIIIAAAVEIAESLVADAA
jgi:Ser/Thr protein kinase RdoA (MazF antagonist)